MGYGDGGDAIFLIKLERHHRGLKITPTNFYYVHMGMADVFYFIYYLFFQRE